MGLIPEELTGDAQAIMDVPNQEDKEGDTAWGRSTPS